MKLLFESWRKFRNNILNEQKDLYKGMAMDTDEEGVVTFRPYAGKKTSAPPLTQKQKDAFLKSQKSDGFDSETSQEAEEFIDSVLDGEYVFNNQGELANPGAHFTNEEEAIDQVKQKCEETGLDEYCCAAIKGRKCTPQELDQFADWMPGTSLFGVYKPTKQDILDDEG